MSEYLKTTPTIEVFSEDGYNETAGGSVMTQTADNSLNPDKGQSTVSNSEFQELRKRAI